MLSVLEPLNKREREILQGLVDDLSNAEIASRLYLSVATIKWYNSQIFSKLGVKNRREAVQFAKQQDLLAVENISQKAKHNLPAQTTRFIGRERELNELIRLFADKQMRLITILAAGGMGKTRLALELAARLAEVSQHDFADGIVFVPLQPLSDPQHVVLQTANSLGLQFAGDKREPKQQLLDYLSNQKVLLVMDNWEHLLEGASLLTDILLASPHTRVLATSREKLNLSGETVYSLKSMDFPEWETPEDALQYDAVQLLLQTAQRIKTDWTVTNDNLDYVARICRLTQGMPLGIVLAASWLDTLSLKDIASEIQRSLDFLEKEMRDVPQRQHSIRAVFNYSWNNLKPDEQQVFMKLSVFRGGFTWNAAQEIAGASARTLQALVNKALVTHDNAGRYDIHELLRQYAEEQLILSGQLSATQDAHTHYFANFLNQRDDALKGQRQVETIQEIESDFENIRRMWNIAIETQDYAIFYQSAETLCWYCFIGLHLTEGKQLFETACTSLEERFDDKQITHLWSHLQLRLFWIRMALYGVSKPYDVMMQQVERWRELAQEADNQLDVALSYSFLGAIAVLNHQPNALTLLEESLKRFRQLKNSFYYAGNFMGFYWEDRDIEKSLACRREILTIRRELGGRYSLIHALFEVAEIELEMGNLEEAVKCTQEMLNIMVEPLRYSWPSTLIGDLAFLQGDFNRAQEQSTKALSAYKTTQQIRIQEFSLLNLGFVACVHGNYEQAMNYHHQGLGTNPNPRHQFYFNWLLALAACGLGDYLLATEANHDALTTSIQIGAVGRITWCLPATVMIDIHNGNFVRATQFLSLAFHHPKSATGWLKKWSLIGALKEKLKNKLGAEQFQTVWEDSKNLDLVQLVSTWLEDNA